MTTEAEPTTDAGENTELDLDTTTRCRDDDQVDEHAQPDDFEIVIDGQRLDGEQIEALLSKPLEELTEAEQVALQPIFDALAEQEQQPQGIDALQLAFNILHDASESLFSKPAAGQRLEHKIALGHAMAALVQAQATRQLALLTQQQLQLVHQAQQAAAAKAAGPASILIPR